MLLKRYICSRGNSPEPMHNCTNSASFQSQDKYNGDILLNKYMQASNPPHPYSVVIIIT